MTWAVSHFLIVRIMKNIRKHIIAFVILLSIAFGCFASEQKDYEKSYVREGFELNLSLADAESNLLKPFEISLEIITSSNNEIEAVELVEPDGLENFEDFSVEQIESEKLADGRVKLLYKVSLLPTMTGNIEIPELKITYQSDIEPAVQGNEEAKEESEGGDERSGEQTILTEPIAVQVQSFLTSEDNKSEVFKNLDVMPVIKVWTAKKYIVVFLVALIIVLAAVVLFVMLKRKKKAVKEKEVFETAHVIALRLLEKFDRSGLLAGEQFDLFYTRISDILRYYIECRFDVNAPDLTTEEFFDRIRNTDQIDSDSRAELKNFFDICDMVKFAKHRPGSEDMKYARAVVEEFVNKTADQESVVKINGNRKLDQLMRA